MAGGIMQLVAYGAQDIYLTGNPQITFFKVVYRRHTNFSMESFKQDFEGNATFGGDALVRVSRVGDLMYRVYLEHDAKFTRIESAAAVTQYHDLAVVERYGDSLIKSCSIEIGGQQIDKHCSMWNRVYSDLTEYNPTGHFGSSKLVLQGDDGNRAPNNHTTGTNYQLMTGNGHGLSSSYTGTHNKMGANSNQYGRCAVNGFTYQDGESPEVAAYINVNKIFIPLKFWFCRNPGLALPLIALQYHEVNLKFTFESLTNLIRTSETQFGVDPGVDLDEIQIIQGSEKLTVDSNFDLWIDYIYLDTDERTRFAQVSHEYLIDQVQTQEYTINNSRYQADLQLNHPVKELVWVLRNETARGTTEYGGRNQPIFSYSSDPDKSAGDYGASPVSVDDFKGKWLLKLNGHDRFPERDTLYFTRTQPWQHHTGYGSVPNLTSVYGQLNADGIATQHSTSIAVYSFALKPEEHQPSGTCNFSRIDNVQLEVNDLEIVTCYTGSHASTYISGGSEGATDINLQVFAVSCNVLRIMSGMGGLAYSN